jgi:hypothetical protein
VVVDAIPITFAFKPRRREVRERLLQMGVKVESKRRAAS